jgi:hypothetical protein
MRLEILAACADTVFVLMDGRHFEPPGLAQTAALRFTRIRLMAVSHTKTPSVAPRKPTTRLREDWWALPVNGPGQVLDSII